MEFAGGFKDAVEQEIALGQLTDGEGSAVSDQRAEWLAFLDGNDEGRWDIRHLLNAMDQHAVSAQAMRCGQEIATLGVSLEDIKMGMFGRTVRLHRVPSEIKE
jgi:hypothetical protein